MLHFDNFLDFSAGRKEYGDAAIGYVQLKRDSQMCIVKAKICPEHKVRNKPYNVTIMVNELTEQVDSALCHDCAASTGMRLGFFL